MARLAIDVFQQHFIHTFSVKVQESFTLIADDKSELVLAKRLLGKCAFFENLFNNEPRTVFYDTSSPKEVLTAFKAFLEGVMPTPDDAYYFIKFGLKIQFEEFVKVCSKNALGFGIPQGGPTAEVTDVVKAFVGALPLRNAIFYAPLYKAIQNWDSQDSLEDDRLQVISAVFDTFDRKRNELFQLLDIPLFEKRLTVALMQKIPTGPHEVVAYLNNAWEKIDLFGPNFNPFDTGVRGFHLVYGQYIIYRNEENCVYFKDLTTEEEPQLLFEECEIFRSHFGNLLVVRMENDVKVVLYWCARKKKFIKIFFNPHFPIKNISLARNDQNVVGHPIILGTQPETMALDLRSGGDYRSFKTTEEHVEDVVGDWKRLRNGENYVNSVTGQQFTFSEEMHIGFSCLRVRALNDTYEIYETVNKDGTISPPHGAVIAISDVFLGID